MHKSEQYRHDPQLDIITGACPHDCPDTCSWLVAVDRKTGRAVDIWGHPRQPVTQGRLCAKVDRYLERTYHAQRLLRPLKRAGPKGSGRFVEVEWAEAIQDIAARLAALIAQHGPETVLPYSYCGTMGLLQGEGMASRFFNRMGASRLAHTICSQAGFEGYVYTIGATEGMEPAAFAQARFILIWGSNTLTSNMHLWPFIQQARRQGGRVIVIDPARTRTARAADEWLPIHPGTDGALALAMMHVIIAEERHDTEYVEQHTLGFEQLAARVQEWTPARAGAVTGIDPARIVELARAYATIRPAAIRINYGLQRHLGGGMAVRTIACLPALVGAWREHGGGIQLSTSGSFRHLERRSLERPELRRGREARCFNMNRLGDALSLEPTRRALAHYRPRPIDASPSPTESGSAVHALIVYNANPAAVAPDQRAVRAGLQRKDLFTVVLEHFQTDTADFADYILPATTQLEHWDLVRPYGHLNLVLNRPAIAPIGESLPNSEIFRRLASAMGYADPCFAEDDVSILRRLILDQTHPRFATVGWEKLLADGYARLNLSDPYLPFADGGFPTPSGKCEFYSERMQQDGYDPLPAYTPPAWQREPKEGRLVCISPPAHSFLNSSFANLSRFRDREEQPFVYLHPHDAAALDIVDGMLVKLENGTGKVVLTARVSETIVSGTILAPSVWWTKFSPDGRNINQTTSAREADMGAGALFYDTLVALETVEEN